MNIVITTGHQYPIGTALTNRIRSYLEGLVALGHCVKVIIYRPSEDYGDYVNKPFGAMNGVSYCSSALSVVRPRNPLIVRLTRIFSYPNCLFILAKSERELHIDVIIQASSKSSMIPLLYLFSRIHHNYFVLENSEYPWFLLKKKVSNIWYRPLYMSVYYKMFDGFLAMTKTLQKFHLEHSKKSAQVFHLPMTVDMQRFDIGITRENYITYIGNVSYYKDGVGILLEAFLKIAQSYPDWKLMVIGDTSRDHEIRDLVKSRNLEDRVILKGFTPRDSVPELLCKSKILALARPDSMQAEGGFPTKLGEYLATGNLVVVTKVGEIPDYLGHKVSAILAEPNSIESFSDSLSYAIANYCSLRSVRDMGYKVCSESFNSTVQASRLSQFLEQKA